MSSPWLWTGSFNVAAGSFNADNAIEIQDSGLAHAYTQEFEQMWGGSDSLPNPAQAEFHTGKTNRLSRHRFVVGTDTFRVYFSPQDRPVDTLARVVSQAQVEIGFCIYSFTYRSLALSMKDRFNHGVWVGGTFDLSESTNTSSCFDSLRQWGIPIFTDKFLSASNLLHEKIMVIDERIAATGSVNWSNAGNYSNDENSLIAYSPAIAGRYRTEIATRYNEAGGHYRTGIEEERSFELRVPRFEDGPVMSVTPNPARRTARISCFLPKAGRASLKVYDAAGRPVLTLGDGYRRSGTSSFILPASSLSPGPYFLVLTDGTGASVGKLVIE